MKINEKGVLPSSDMFIHTSSKAALSAYFCLESIGNFHCNSEYCVSRDEFVGFLIVYLAKGEMVAECQGHEYELYAGDALILDSMRPHIYAARSDIDINWLHFSGASSAEFYNLITQMGHVHTLKNPAQFLKAFNACFNSFMKKSPLHEVELSCNIHIMLCELMISTDAQGQKASSAIRPVLDYIQEHYYEKLSLELLSSIACLSPYHFARLFKAETGYSPHNYILQTRLNIARHLLRRTRSSIKQIAFSTGFSSESHFVSAFNKAMKLTPKAYRDRG